jgi:hypothetical protein
LKGGYKKIARFDFTEGWLQKKRTKVGLDTKYLKGGYKKSGQKARIGFWHHEENRCGLENGWG